MELDQFDNPTCKLLTEMLESDNSDTFNIQQLLDET